MVVGIVGVSIIAFFAVILGTYTGMEREDFASGIWPVVSMLPLIGLPTGFVIILVLLAVSTRRRRQGGTGASGG
jgi:ABC-type dipeptide/oligopeptide/nickel transport system permease component